VVHPESRMLIDGALVETASGATFDNINPATEEVIGQVTDASKADMHQAIVAARRAFDETDWSTNHAFRNAGRQAVEAEAAAVEDDLGGIVARHPENISHRCRALRLAEPHPFDVAPGHAGQAARRERGEVQPLGGLGPKREGQSAHGNRSFRW